MAMNYNRTQAYQNGSDPYSGWGDGDGGDAAAGAAVGMMSGLALGSAIDSVPRAAQPVYPPEGTTNNYYYSNGNYVAPAPSGGYQTVPPPMGASLPSLPVGASPVTINGTQYFFANGTYYKPFFNGSQVVYQVSQV